MVTTPKGKARGQCNMRVTLLGTGGPELTPDRMGAATLIEVEGRLLLFDAGRGVLQRLYECRVPLNSVTRVFFTHLHSDHIEGLPNLWMTPWFLLGRTEPMQFWGPAGTEDMLTGMRRFLGHDVAHRVGDDCPAEALATSVLEFDREGVVFESDGLTVTAVPVDHTGGRNFNHCGPAFAFVVETEQRKVAISGDCTLSEDLIRAADGADLIVHNVFAPSTKLLSQNAHKRKVAKMLTSPEQVGEVLRRSNARMGVFTHVINMDSSNEDILRRTRAAGYDGELVMGTDRMVVDVGEEIRVLEPLPLDSLEDVTTRGDG